MKRIFIVGSAGIPAAYGGFETLAENLVAYRQQQGVLVDLTVVCSGRASSVRTPTLRGAKLSYVPLPANGMASIAYDAWSLALAVWKRADVILLLGVSGAVVLPLVRCLGRTRVVTNIDGIEWRRAKWGWVARNFLRFSEWLAVRCSHTVVADNQGVAEYVAHHYGKSSSVIAYGGDHAVHVTNRPYPSALPPNYALALCRVEPENNVAMILEAFSHTPELPLVFVGNWNASLFGKRLRERYQAFRHLVLADPEYDTGVLKTLREGASLYVHGHSAGGTNPSLVEMMHFGVPHAAFDCVFNRYTTQGQAIYFADAQGLREVIAALPGMDAEGAGARMRDVARQFYTWSQVGAQYFQVFAL